MASAHSLQRFDKTCDLDMMLRTWTVEAFMATVKGCESRAPLTERQNEDCSTPGFELIFHSAVSVVLS